MTITNMSTGDIIYQNTCDHQSRLWYLDIPELIRLGRVQPQGHHKTCAFGGATEEPTRKDRQSTTAKTGRIGQEEVSAIIWLHNCLNHSASPTMIANALRDGAWMGINTCIKKEDVIKVFERNPCVICALAKKNKKPTPEGSGIRTVIGEELSCDYVGEIHPKSVHGNTGAYIFTDSATGMEHVYPVRSKTEFLQCAKKTIEYYASHRHITRKIRCDAGSSENAAEAKSQLATIHIELRPAAPGKQNQNPVERHIQTTKKGTAATLFGQATLHAGWWDDAMCAFVECRNVTPNSLTNDQSPEELVTGRKPDISERFKYPFGTVVTCARVGKSGTQSTIQLKNELGIVVGSDPSGNGAMKVYIPGRGYKPFIRYDCIPIQLKSRPLTTQEADEMEAFAENETGDIMFRSLMPQDPEVTSPVAYLPFGPGHRTIIPELQQQQQQQQQQRQHSSHSPPPSPTRAASMEAEAADREIHTRTTRRGVYYRTAAAVFKEPRAPKTAAESELDNLADEDAASSSDELSDHEKDKQDVEREYAGRNKRSARSWQRLRIFAAKRKQRGKDNPTLRVALKEDWDRWKKPCIAELKQIEEFDVKDVITLAEVPPNAQVVPLLVDLKAKYNAEGDHLKDKCRILVSGNLEWRDELEQLYAPTATDKTKKMLFAIAVELGWHIRGLDIVGAFLGGELKSPVYVRLPREFEDLDPETLEPLTDEQARQRYGPIIWRLKKSLYGMRRSPKIFYDKLASHLQEGGYTRLVNDPCVFFKEDKATGQKIIFDAHVDDLTVFSSSLELYEELKTHIRKIFKVTEEESLENTLGHHIDYNDDGSITMTMPNLLNKAIETYLHGDGANEARTPMSASFNDADQNASPPANKKEYERLLGILLYLVKVRGDIAYAVSRLATRKESCTEKDWQALKRVLRYLKGTRHIGLTFTPSNTGQREAVIRLFSWADAAYAVHVDSRSHLGTCMSIGKHNTAKFQQTSAKAKRNHLSSTEAEVDAGVSAACNIIWARALLAELGFPQYGPTTLYADNLSMITLCSDFSGNHKRTKHFLGQINFMLDQVRQGIIKLEYLRTEDHHADAHTKALGPTELAHHIEHMQGPVKRPRY